MDARIRLSICCVTVFFYCLFGLYAEGENKENVPLKIEDEIVFLKIGITDPLNRFVGGLKKEYFKTFEDKVEQKIVYFEQKIAPVSVGIILDTSQSMKESEYKKAAKKSILQFLKYEKPQDESFLIIFNKNTKLIENLKEKSQLLDDAVTFQSGGNTALYDAVYLGLDHIGRSVNDTKALVIITDGEDNGSRYSPKEVLEFAKESDVQVYWIGKMGNIGYEMSLIREMVKTTGGRALFPKNYNEISYYFSLIQMELCNQYILGYKPSNQTRDGKWRRIKVELDAPMRLPKLNIRVREGYYAPKY